MIILIEGKRAMIKSGSSFEYIAENRLFMGRDSYTLALSFPLRGCPENREIFGNIDRVDVSKQRVFLDCIIQDGAFSVAGSVLVVGVSELEVKCQFTQGRCEHNSKDPFEETYINELELVAPPNKGSFTPADAWKSIDAGNNEVALPWINESHPTVFNNWVVHEGGVYKWNPDMDLEEYESRGDRPGGRPGAGAPKDSLPAASLSWQPYLLFLAKDICRAINYSCDFSIWEKSGYRHLICCNTLPPTWDLKYNRVLPHWTVTEFFEKLELLLMGEFNFDHHNRAVSFNFSKEVMSDIPPVNLPVVVESYETDIADDGLSCSYIGCRRLAYAVCDHSLQPYYACDWYVDGKPTVEYSDIDELLDKCRRRYYADDSKNPPKAVTFGEPLSSWRGNWYPSTNGSSLYHTEAEDMYFVLRSIGRKYLFTDSFGFRRYEQICVMQPVNVYGSGCVESDDKDTDELDFVPVCIADTYISDDDDLGYMMTLSPGDYENPDLDGGARGASPEDKDRYDAIKQYLPASIIEKGEKENASEFYNVINVAFWTGDVPEPGKSPYPLIDKEIVTQDWQHRVVDIPGLRLFGSGRNFYHGLPEINPTQKFRFSFLSDTIPNPRAVFYISGKRYLCEKITATFTEDGMSQLMKGEFYPLLEE